MSEAFLNAHWIGPKEPVPPHSVVNFRRTFAWSPGPTPALLQVAADTKYRLWVNGRLVVAEGQLKRGPNARDTYFDTIDLSAWVITGQNLMAIQVHFLGVTGSSHVDSGTCGLLARLGDAGQQLVSDSAWRCHRDAGWSPGLHRLGIALAEAEEIYRAPLADTGWQLPGHDDSSWSPCLVLGRAGAAPWNRLEARPLPLLKDFGLVTSAPPFVAAAGSTVSIQVPRQFRRVTRISWTFSLQRVVALATPFGNKSLAESIFIFSASSTDDYWRWTVDIREEPVLRCQLVRAGQTETLTADVSLAAVPFIEAPEARHQLVVFLDQGRLVTLLDGFEVCKLPATSLDGAAGNSRDGWIGSSTQYGLEVAAENGVLWEGAPQSTGVSLAAKTSAGSWVPHGFQVVHETVAPTRRYTLDLPYNAQFTPWFKLRAPAGKIIQVTTSSNDHYQKTSWPMEVVSTRYITRDGTQEWEGFAWLNGEQLHFDVENDVEVLGLGYRETSFGAELSGRFECDNADLNRLWTKAQRTLLVTMRDNFMDCPDRERRFYAGDATNEMEEVYYGLDLAGRTIAAKAIDNLVGFASPQGVLFTVSPHGEMELPVQQLAFVTAVWDYYQFTADRERVVRSLPALENYLMLWQVTDSLVVHRPGSWDWLDWGQNIDVTVLENAWYALACRQAAKLAELAGNEGLRAELERRRQVITNAVNATCWAGHEYRSPAYLGDTDDRANAMAWMAGIATAEKASALAKVFRRHFNASIYMEKYVLESLFQMGFTNQALERLQFRYGPMIADAGSTLWEHWDRLEGSLNHGWSGGCLSVLSRYVLGMTPLDPGFRRVRLAPQLGTLTRAEGQVATEFGDLRVEVRREARGDREVWILVAHIPAGIEAQVVLPSDATGGVLVVERPSGDWSIESETFAKGVIHA